MKKVTIQLLIILLLPAAAGAQALKTGLFVGTRLPFHTESEGAAYRCSGNSNMDISYQLKYGYRLHVQGGLLYMSSNRRVTPLATDSFADVRLGYVGIPLQAGYSFVDRKDLQLRVLGGGCYRIPVMVSPRAAGSPRSPLSQMPCTNGICAKRGTPSSWANCLQPSFPKM